MTQNSEQSQDFKYWWIQRPTARRLLSVPLYFTTRNYRLWRNARLTPRKLRKLMRAVEEKFPTTHKQLIGRDDEYQQIMSSIGFHVVKDRYILDIFRNAPPPKFFILRGSSGTGKSILAQVCIREGVVHGIMNGVNIQPMSVRGSDVFDPYYGQSARNLAHIFDTSFKTPTILFIDEFESFGKKIDKAASPLIQSEDIRVQSIFISSLTKVLETKVRTVVIVATNVYESIREDVRRRGFVIDLDQNVNREMLLAILSSELANFGWNYLNPEQVMTALERAVSVYRQTQLTPFDVIDVCYKVRNKKIEPLRRNLFLKYEERSKTPKGFIVTLEDFEFAARELRGYVETEKSSEVISSILKIKPSITYDDVGGLFGVKERIFKAISLSLRPDLVNKLGWIPPKGFILWGEPGCGKTHISKAIARENGASFFYAPAAQLLINAKWVGEPEKNVKDLFAMARKVAPSVVFFDEFDIIAGKRKGDPVGDKITAQILTELDGLQPLENVIVIAATNKPEMVDEAILNRVEPNILEIPLPKNDEERYDIITIHLKQNEAHLHPEVTTKEVLNIIKQHRIVSPRVMAEIIREANRLRSQEIVAAWETHKGDAEHRQRTAKMFKEDLERLREVITNNRKIGEAPTSEEEVFTDNYKIRLYHFEKAVLQLEQDLDKELIEAQESLMVETHQRGVAYGIGTDPQGRRGIVLLTECTINKQGTGKVRVTGAAKAAVLGPATAVEDVSVGESARNVIEYIRSYIREKLRLDIAKYDFTFQVISPLEGAAGMGVSGPSLGATFSVAAVSELSGLSVNASVVMTGKGDIKGNVGPVGGVGWRGAGKFLAATQTKKIKFQKFLLPQWNYEKSIDEWQVLQDKKIAVIPIKSQVEVWEHALG
ncbi:MAG TPA: AAA family ATPase, partial [Methylomirabilota bacterium]|nr:AAA family ATPase [Methylomirabilota bacterium]